MRAAPLPLDIPPAPAEAVSEFCAPVDRRASGLASAFTWWKRWSLRYKIRSSVSYLELCAHEGITTGRSIAEWKQQLRDMREQLRQLNGDQA